jgi:hypothetical protein
VVYCNAPYDEKLGFLFQIFDFEGKGRLDASEVQVAVKVVLNGI